MSENGFIDLRLDHASQAVGDDSVWPSFTDIMTVIVMIFMMTLVVIMLRNTELNQALTTSLKAKEETFQQNQGLSFEVNTLKSRVDELSSSLNLTAGERDALNRQLLLEIQRVEALASDKLNLSTKLEEEVIRAQQLANDKVGLEGEIVTVRSEAEELAAEKIVLTELRDQISVELSSTREQNQKLAEEVEVLLQQRESLQLAQTQSKNQIALLKEKETTLTRQMDALSQQFQALQIESEENAATLSDENQTLSEKIQNVTSQLTQLNVVLQEEQQQNIDLSALLEAEQARYAGLEKNQQNIADRIIAADKQILVLNRQIREKEQENEELQEQAQFRGQQLVSLRDEYDSLEEKYRDLIRPARSSAGKYVVEVWVQKTNGVLNYRIREPGGAEPRTINRENLDALLSSLKDSKGRTLYTKVIIPENSQLSHNEAWRFTQEILTRYDYYYQPVN
ncbi:MAG: hypothetical protein AAF402_01275 [Pseudomonadota bacterium]